MTTETATQAWASSDALRSNPQQFKSIGDSFNDKHVKGTEVIETLNEVATGYDVHKGPYAELIIETSTAVADGLAKVIASYPAVSEAFLDAYTTLLGLENRSDSLRTSARNHLADVEAASDDDTTDFEAAEGVLSGEFAAIRTEESAALNAVKAVIEEQPTDIDITVKGGEIQAMLSAVLGEIGQSELAPSLEIANLILEDHKDGEIEANYLDRPFDGGPEQDPIRIAERNIAVTEAVEAEKAFLDARAGLLDVPGDLRDSLTDDLREDRNEKWDLVDELFGEEFEDYSDGELEAEFEGFDPVFRPLIQYRAGVGPRPTDLESQRMITNVAAERVVRFNEEGTETQLEEAQQHLADSATEETRLISQETSWEGDDDVYPNAEASIENRIRIIGVDAETAEAVGDYSHQQAMQAIPVNRNEAANQTKNQAWDAIEAENALVNHDRLGPDGFSGTEDEYWEQYAQLEQDMQVNWNAVQLRVAMEKRVISESAPGPEGRDELANFEDTLDHRGLPEGYLHKVKFIAADTQPLSDEYLAEPDEIAEPYVEQIQTAYEEDGALGYVEARSDVNIEVASNPYIAGDSTFSLDPATGSERLSAVFEVIDEEVADEREQSIAEFPDAIIALSETRTTSGVFDPEVDVEISIKMREAGNAFPPDQLGQIVADSTPAWEVGFRAVLTPKEGDPVINEYGDEAQTIFGTYMTLGDEMSFMKDGDIGVDAIADVFEDQLRSDDEFYGVDYYAYLTENHVAENGGGIVAVEVLNRLIDYEYDLSKDSDQILADNEYELFSAFKTGSEYFLMEAEQQAEDYIDNRDELDHMIIDFTLFNSQNRPQGQRQPGELDVANVELGNAVEEYLEQKPEVAKEDARLFGEILDDGEGLFYLDMARQQLSDSVRERYRVDSIDQTFDAFLGSEYASLYTNNPVVRAQTAELMRQLMPEINVDPSTIDPEKPFAWLGPYEDGWPGPDNTGTDFYRFGRGAQKYLSKLPKSDVSSAAGWALGPIDFVYGVIQLNRALDSERSNHDRAIRGVYAASLFAKAAIPTRGFIHNVAVGQSSLSGIAERANNRLPRLGLEVGHGKAPVRKLSPEFQKIPFVRRVAKKGGGYRWVRGGADGRLPVKTPIGAISFAKEVYDTGSAFRDSRELTGAGYGLLTASSALGLWSSFAAGGPPGWIAGLVYIVGSAVVFQGNRVDASNRYETAEGRRFLSHIGSINSETGELRPPEQTSNAADHNADVRDYEPGDEHNPDVITYRGISANAVDELLNHSGNAANPISSAATLNALAERHGLTPRELLLHWFDPDLEPGEQKELPANSFDVDLDPKRDQDVVHPSFYEDRPNQLGVNGATRRYVDNELTANGKMDPALIEAVLSGNTPAGTEPPSDEVLAELRVAFADRASITTLAELEAFMEYKGYPVLPDETPLDPIPLRPRPTIDAVSYQQPYVVQQGDTLWSIAETLGEQHDMSPQQVIDLLAYHNEATSSPHRQFDSDRADSNFDTNASWYDPRRDPDLLQPGDQIVLQVPEQE